ncbi:MAG TPA: hypothetical protein VMX14_07925, partial [Anaerolineae bacterium]|nr:hypothetical protein [Anaerolineae bacterium]
MSAPEGVPPVVMPALETPREMAPAPDVLSLEERREAAPAPESGRASPPLEVRREAERRGVEDTSSPERPAEDGARGVSPSVMEPRVGRQIDTPIEPPRGAEPQVAPRPSVGQEAAEGAPVRETRDLQLSRLVEEARKEPEGHEAIQQARDLGMAPLAEVPSVQPGPEVEDAGLTAMHSPAETGEAVSRYRDLEQASLGPAAPEPGVGTEAQGVVPSPSRPRGVVATPREAVGPRDAARLGVQRAREPETPRRIVSPTAAPARAAPVGAGTGYETVEPEAGVARRFPEAAGLIHVQPSYTALEPEYDGLGIGVEPSRVVSQRQAPGVLRASAARRELPVEASIDEPERGYPVVQPQPSVSSSEGLPVGEIQAVRRSRVPGEEPEAPIAEAAVPHLLPERDLGAEEPQPPALSPEALRAEETPVVRALSVAGDEPEASIGEAAVPHLRPERDLGVEEPQPPAPSPEALRAEETPVVRVLRVPGEEPEAPIGEAAVPHLRPERDLGAEEPQPPAPSLEALRAEETPVVQPLRALSEGPRAETPGVRPEPVSRAQELERPVRPVSAPTEPETFLVQP